MVDRGRGRAWLAVLLCGLALCAQAQVGARLESADVKHDGTPQGSEREPVEIDVDLDDDTLTVEFDRPMRVWDNKLAADQLRTVPALPLQCAWGDEVTILCKFGEGRYPAAATAYTVHLRAGLFTRDGDGVPARSTSVDYERPTLSAHVNDWNQGAPTIQLYAQGGSDAAQIAEVLRLSVDGRDVPVPPLKATPRVGSDTGIYYQLELGAIAQRDARVRLIERPGLRSSSGPLRGAGDGTLIDAVINEPFRLRGVACDGREQRRVVAAKGDELHIDCLPGEKVQLAFSHPLRADAVRLWSTTLPVQTRLLGPGYTLYEYGPVRFDPEGNRPKRAPGQGLDIAIGQADSERVLVFGDDLRSARDGSAIAPMTLRVRTGGYRPAFEAAHRQGLILDGKRPPALLESVNAARYDTRVLGISMRERTQTLRVPDSSTPVPSALKSEVAAQTLAEGGWMRWQVSDLEQALEFAAPAFDLFAVAGRRELLAWASDWNGGGAVAGATIELLLKETATSQPRVVAHATTGADGTALLRLPDDVGVSPAQRNEGPEWWLRADGRGSGSRAVLPLGVSNSWSNRLGMRAARRLWGVADKPLYRAGETVRYRIWRRELDGTRLRDARDTAPQPLMLTDSSGKRFQTWDASPDPSGAFGGELVLPVHLPDERYCIGMPRDHRTEGSCFYVGSFRGQDLWVEASAQDRVLREGMRFEVDLSAGYYSGGPAAAAAVVDVTGMLTGLALDEAYPQFRDYRFIDVDTDASAYGIGLRSNSDNGGKGAVTDREGRHRLSVPVEFKPDEAQDDQLPAFGLLRLTAEVSPSEREGTASNEVKSRYARYDRYVGLRSDPAWLLDAKRPVRLEGVVIDAEGRDIADAAIEVEVRYGDAAAPVLQRCTMLARRSTPCEFEHQRAGTYLLLARSGDAAPTTLRLYVWGDAYAGTGAKAETSLQLIQAPAPGATKAQVQLTQPYARARVLLVSRDGDRILGHRVDTLSESMHGLDVELGADPGAGVDVTAYVLDAAPPIASSGEDGYRVAPARARADLRIDLPRRARAAPAVTLRFEAAPARPGENATIVLHNAGAQSREVTLTVLDDALRALAGEEWASFDPQGPQWLGKHEAEYGARLADMSFAAWIRGPWRVHLPWPSPSANGLAANADATTLGRIAVTSSQIKRADIENAQPSTELDRIEVTGSRIALKDVFPTGQGRLDAPARRRDPASALQAIARVRTRFADSALWQPGLRLAPGETRRIALILPDNLTRWRALAWSNGTDEDFELSEATLEVGLPLEVRLQAPARLYPGDRSRLAANVRQIGETPLVVRTVLQTEGGGAATSTQRDLSLAARGQSGYASEFAPRAVGSVLASAAVEAGDAHDAVAARIEVTSPTIAAQRLQAGWLGESELVLPLPRLPDGASAPRLSVSLQRGAGALIERWSADLRDYPHRCWEQILSRAVAAALAIERDGAAQWPDAEAAVREALDNAAVFQDSGGGFRYFGQDYNQYGADFDNDPSDAPQVALTAYSADALYLLQRLGYPVAPSLRTDALSFLKTQATRERLPNSPRVDTEALNDAAIAAGARDAVAAKDLERLWMHRGSLTLPAQVALARALARTGHPAARQAVADLLAQAPARGPSRALSSSVRYDRWMSSDLREQCALIGLLGEYPDLAEPRARRELVAGLTDLYAGGSAQADTQSGATCLAALRDAALVKADESFVAQLRLGDERGELRLAPGDTQAQWRAEAATGTLRIAPREQGAAPVAYFAQVDYGEDARHAQASAIGLDLERRYEVLRDGRWAPVAQHELRIGDWVRVSLIVNSAAPRHFVAITDEVPGGLRPTDLNLNGVAGLDLKRVSDPGAYWFSTRRLDPRSPRFYAEYLPPGRHELHYFALAGNGGDYLAAPAQVELMYGKATRARTAAARLRILPPAGEKAAP